MIELSIDNLPSSLTELLFTGESFSLELQTTEYNQSLDISEFMNLFRSSHNYNG